MKPSLIRSDSAVDEQAAFWAARLDGDVLEAGERAALDAWLAESPAHRAALSSYCQLSADLEEQLPALVASGAVQMPAPAEPRGKVLTFPRVMSLALATAAVVAVGLWAVRPAPPVQNIAIGVAQRTAQTLADGTRVELNANTSLRFENLANERRVHFAGGEAIFMVAKDPAKPFIILTPTGSVRVTGTTFNVRADGTDAVLEVTVTEGSVEVRPRDGTDGPISLKANDRLLARGKHIDVKQALSQSELDDLLAWRHGQIVFNEVPLADAVARFARYHGRSYHVDPSLAAETVGGLHRIDDLSGFMQFIDSAYAPARATYDQNGSLIIR